MGVEPTNSMQDSKRKWQGHEEDEAASEKKGDDIVVTPNQQQEGPKWQNIQFKVKVS